MSNPKCAACKKTVYVVERLNCLDQAWHKWCFKCQVCGCTLTLKSYRGMGGLPYCKQHYPQVQSANDDATVGLHSGQQSYAVQDPYATAGAPSADAAGYDAPTGYEGGAAGGGGYDAGGYAEEAGYDEGYAEEGYAEEAGYDEGYAEEAYAEEGGYEEAAAGGEEGYTATAVFDYEADGDDELSFAVGDIIAITEFIDDGWWSGTLNGDEGMFPANYVELNE